jgi:beta-phosphoglucomutase family hydrolase
MSTKAGIGVIFDMDGVLVDSAAPHLQSWRQLAEENGHDVTDAQFAATFGRQNRDIIPLLFGEVSESRMQQLSDRKERVYRDLVRETPPIVPGAVALVQDLHRAGVLLAIGSSGPRENIELVLDRMGVADRFLVIVSADDVRRGKPDPQVFSLACERLGLAPAHCVVVEDAPAGVIAARRAGARAVAVLMHHPATAFDDADLIVDRLADLSVTRLMAVAAGDGNAGDAT